MIDYETVTITGTVTDLNGEPLPSVIVKIEGTSIVTITDLDGKYILTNVPADAEKIEVSYVGFITQIIEINDRSEIDVVLEADPDLLDEVVVTGLGVETDDKKVGYSSTTVTSDYDAKGRRDRTPLKDRSSKVSGVDVSTSYDAPDPVYSTDVIEIVADDKSYDGDFDFADYSDDGGADYSQGDYRSGQLTAGEVNDFGKWEMWQDITEDELSQYITAWQMHPHKRYSVLVTSEDNKPVIDATVYLKSGNETIWSAKTDNTGKAELWENMYDSVRLRKLNIQVEYQGTINSINNPSTFHNGINSLTINTNSSCDIPSNVDIAFVFDATGSMADEMRYLQAEILNVVERIDSSHSDLTVNLGSVFYRDHGDAYLTVHEDLTNNIPAAVDFFKNQNAGGGGDFPEAVHSGLDVAINKFSWSKDARARIIFLVLDAPPHSEQDVVDSLKDLTTQAAQLGIRIVPVTCSGIDKSTEYLMRSMALSTNGTYVFLTDDSGIGGSHIKPTTDEWEVEYLNDLIVRLVNQYVVTPDCDNQIIVDDDDLNNDTILVNYPDTLIALNDTNFVDSTLVSNPDSVSTDTVATNVTPPVEHKLKIYPNPTSGPLTLEIDGEIEEFYVCDFSGKILQRHLVDNQSEIRIDIGMYTNGVYFIRYFVGDQLKSGKVILMR